VAIAGNRPVPIPVLWPFCLLTNARELRPTQMQATSGSKRSQPVGVIRTSIESQRIGAGSSRLISNPPSLVSQSRRSVGNALGSACSTPGLPCLAMMPYAVHCIPLMPLNLQPRGLRYSRNASWVGLRPLE
jgi:hypothetical protein